MIYVFIFFYIQYRYLKNVMSLYIKYQEFLKLNCYISCNVLVMFNRGLGPETVIKF